MTMFGALPAVAGVQHVDHVQRVPGRAGDHLRAEPGRLVVDHVQPGDAALGAEELPVRAGVDGGDGHDEAHPVDGRDQAAAPGLRQRDGALAVDQRGVGPRVGLGPQVVQADVPDPVALERRHALLDHRPIADVQRVRGQAGRDGDVQVRQPGAAAGDGGERPGESRLPAHHLQQHLGQVDPRQHRADPLAQVDQAPRFRDRLDPLDVQPPVRIHADRVVDLEPSGHAPVGVVQQPGVRCQEGVRVFGQPERGQHRVLGCGPRFAVQQLGARVAPAGGGLGVDVAAFEPGMELGQHAEHVGVALDPPLAGEHQAGPGAADQIGVDVTGS